MGRAWVILSELNDSPVPFEYPYYLASALYSKIRRSDFELGSAIHDKMKYKQFTFSWLNVPNRTVLRQGIKIVDGHASFQVSSPSSEILKGFVEGLLSETEIRLGKAIFEVEKVCIQPAKELHEAETFRCLSPILVRTIKEIDGKRTVWDLDPQEPKFLTNLQNNLVKKYNDYYGEQVTGRFDVEGFENVRRTRIRIKDTYNRAYFMEFRVQGDPELITFAYDAGLGERNSMGFGMLETV